MCTFCLNFLQPQINSNSISCIFSGMIFSGQYCSLSGFNFLSHILTVLTWHWPIKWTWYLLGSGKVEVVAHFVLQILCLALYNCKKKCSSDWSNHSYNADFLLSSALQSESALSCTILIARQAISCALPNIVLLTTKLAGLTGLVWKQRMTSSRPSHLTTSPSPFPKIHWGGIYAPPHAFRSQKIPHAE